MKNRSRLPAPSHAAARIAALPPAAALALSLAIGGLLLAAPLSADEYGSARGFSIDLPEGFAYAGGDGSSRFSFSSPDGSVIVDIAVYPSTRFSGARLGAEDAARRLSGRGGFQDIAYGGYDAAFGPMEFKNGDLRLEGYGLFVNDANPRGPQVGADKETFDLIVLSYAPAGSDALAQDLVASAIDGFSIAGPGYAGPGPLGAAARGALPVAPPTKASVRFGSATVEASWDRREAAICQETVEREYRVMSAYASSPALLDAAIARFYRLILRDAAPALDELALGLSRAWETGAWSSAGTGGSVATGAAVPAASAAAKGSSASHGIPADPRAYAEALLSWVQGFRYERSPGGSDVVNPITAAFEGRGDCDSRVIVMAIALRRENIRSILMISLKHQHALAGVDAPGAGARFPHGGKSWLVAETTGKVGIGLIDSSMSGKADWLGVEFPF